MFPNELLHGVSAEQAMSALHEALAKAMPASELAKTWVQSNSATSGLTAYSLEAPAKLLIPVITPLRNKLPRVTGGAGIQANWRAITAYNTGAIGAGVGEGRRGGVLSTNTADYLAQFRTIGMEDAVTFEAQLAGQGFDDVKARAVQGMLRSLMIAEEAIILGGLGTFGLGTTPTPTLANATTGGALATGQTIYVRCVALTLDGYARATSVGVQGDVIRTNADGTSQTHGGGAAQASAAASQATGATSTNLVSATVAPVKGAVGYAWFVGNTDGTAANLKLHAVTTINSTTIASLPAGGAQALPTELVSGDKSQNSLIHDGYFSMVGKSGSGAYWNALPTGTAGTGTKLTSDGVGGIVEIDAVLKWYWDNLRMSPTEMWVNSQEMQSIRARALTGSTSSLNRIMFNSSQGGVQGGGMVRGYLNQYAMGGPQEIPIQLHPNVPPGTILFLAHSIPYPLSGVNEVTRILCRQDYYQMEWPLKTRSYEYGVYSDQVMQCYFIPGQAVLTNIAPG